MRGRAQDPAKARKAPENIHPSWYEHPDWSRVLAMPEADFQMYCQQFKERFDFVCEKGDRLPLFTNERRAAVELAGKSE